MSYESPIEIAEKMSNQVEKDIMEVVLSYGIKVDKDELVKALSYDRKQYEKGYADGQKAGGRTAKVKRYSFGETLTYDFDGQCECGKWVDSLWDYCPSCGAKLEWK